MIKKSPLFLIFSFIILFSSACATETDVNPDTGSTGIVNKIQNPFPAHENSQGEGTGKPGVSEGKTATDSIKRESITEDVYKKATSRDAMGKTVPVLYYHAVDDTIVGLEELYVSPSEFDKQMNYLKEKNYNVITFEELDKADSINNPIIITLDDGYEDNYTYAYPILKKYSFKATIFICSDVIDKPLFLKTGQISEMLDLVNFQSHTISHPYLTQVEDDKLEEELAESKSRIEAITGTEVTILAYPYGDYNKNVIKFARKYYQYAVVSGGGLYRKGDSNYEIKRVYVPRSLDLKGFEKKLKQ